MHLTVVICTYNRVEMLTKAVASLNAAEHPVGAELEILVIANNCSDGTSLWLKSYVDSMEEGCIPLHWAEQPIPGKSYALNRAIETLKSPLVTFVDDDHQVDRLFFKAILDAFKTYPQASLICGKILPDWTGAEPSWVHDEGPYKIYPLPIPRFDLGDKPLQITKNTSIPGGGNLTVKTTVFARIGEFSTYLGPKGHDLGGSEDTDFVYRALNSDEIIVYSPAITQYHYVDTKRLSFLYLLRKSYRRNSSLTAIKSGSNKTIPRYLWRKLATYSLSALLCFDRNKFRFYAVRVAGCLGEIRGHSKGAGSD